MKSHCRSLIGLVILLCSAGCAARRHQAAISVPLPTETPVRVSPSAVSGTDGMVWPNRQIAEQSIQMSCQSCAVQAHLNGKDLVEVFFATDRRVDSSRSSGFGSELAAAEETRYGTALVSIPPDHKMGVLESPSFFRFEVNPNPDKHVVLTRVQPLSREGILGELRKSLTPDNKKEGLLFIPGYNTSFEDALKRTAQLKYDLAFAGPCIVFSWPSQGRYLAYHEDEESVEWSAPHLAAFLRALTSETGIQRVHIVAHSMGNRALLAALDSLTTRDVQGKLGEVVLAAPDVSTPKYRQMIARVGVATKGMTLYASSRDEALIASEAIHHYPRAGQSGKNLIIVPSVETVDASVVDTSLIGHSYFGDSSTMISDLFYLINDELAAAQRVRLVMKRHENGTYWSFVP